MDTQSVSTDLAYPNNFADFRGGLGLLCCNSKPCVGAQDVLSAYGPGRMSHSRPKLTLFRRISIADAVE
jgi:hypothetical protein